MEKSSEKSGRHPSMVFVWGEKMYQTLSYPNEDFGRRNKRWVPDFRIGFQLFVSQIEYSRPLKVLWNPHFNVDVAKKTCAISYQLLNEGRCICEYSKFREIKYISFKSFRCLLESSLIVEYSRMQLPSLSSGCEIAQFLVRHTARKLLNTTGVHALLHGWHWHERP